MFSRALSVLLCASVAFTSPPMPDIVQDVDRLIPRECGTFISDEELRATEEHFRANKVSANPERGSADDVPINVYFHVISQDGTPQGGNIPDNLINDQMRVLNKDFSGTGLKFVLASANRTINSDWFDNAEPDTQQQTDMKNALRQGGAADLNVYSVGFASDSERSTSSSGKGLLGYATFPSFYADNPTDDGVVFLYATVPRGGQKDYQEGKTLTHEVGHWVGLYHTFEGGCSGDGDTVDDTPAEASPAYGCPVGRDTCPGSGPDPIHNYMDYGVDTCLNQFTQGQITRLRDQVTTYRGIRF